MSAFPDAPDHFVSWLARRGEAATSSTFVPRLLYGSYLRELLEDAVTRSAGRLSIVRGDAIDLLPAAGSGVRLADRRSADSDAVVLAVGNLPPHTPPGLDPDALGNLYKPDPWAPNATRGLGSGDTVLIIGTGLTMVDVALRVEAEGFTGRIVALSRRGLLPRAHGEASKPAEPRNTRPTTVASALTREVRDRAAAVGWRSAADELRPFTQSL